MFLSIIAEGKISCLELIKRMDKSTMSSDYQKIAWYTYQHKKKLDYIQHAYSLLEKTRNTNSNEKETQSTNSEMIVAIPTVEIAMAESEAITAINSININLLNLLIYRSIKKEIDEGKLRSSSNGKKVKTNE